MEAKNSARLQWLATLSFVLAVVGFYTLSTFTSFWLPDGSAGSIMIRAATACVVVVAFLLLVRVRSNVSLTVFIPLYFFAFCYSVRLLVEFSTATQIIFQLETVLLLFFVSGLLPAFMFVKSSRYFNDSNFIHLMIFSSILFLIGFAMNFERLSAEGSGRLMLDKVNPIALSQTAFSFIMFYWLLFFQGGRVKLLYPIVIALLLVIALSTGSRSSLTSGVLVLSLFLFFRKGQSFWAALVLILAVLGIVISGFLEEAGYASARFSRLMDTGPDSDRSYLLHVLAWTGAFSQFLENPVLGVSIIEARTGYHPHNIYLESLLATGLIGGGAFFLHFLLCLRAAVRILKSTNTLIWPAFIALIFLREAMTSATSGAIWSNSIYWISSTVVLAFYVRSKTSPVRSSFKP